MDGFGFLDYFFWLILIIAFVVEAWALFDALTVPANAFPAASKLTKNKWMIILGVAAVLGMACAAFPLQGASPVAVLIGILPVAAFVAAAIYHADVKPAVKQFKGRGRGSGGGGNMGPYGPW